MATRNLSDYDSTRMPDASDMRFVLVVSEWNENVTRKLLEGASHCFVEHGVKPENIDIHWVPGSFELVYGAAAVMRQSSASIDAIVVLGCVVRGGTPHFEYVCQGVTQGVAQLNAQADCPVIFGLLTTDNMQQSLDRAGGIYGNKGIEAAQTAIKMAALRRRLEQK